MTTIRYFVPEDGDTEEHPNIYLMPKPTQSGFSPRLRDIKDSFPMPGNYHFRFKCPLIPGTDREKGAVSVWMDCIDDDQHVGVWRNTIFAKVTRIDMDDDDDDEDFVRPVPVSNTTNNHATKTNMNGVHRAVSASAPSHNHSQPAPQATQKPTRVPVPAPVSSGDANLLGGFDTHHTVPAAPSHEGDLLGVAPAPSSGGGLLDMDGPPTHHGSTHSSAHDDFLGMTSTPLSSPPVSGGMTSSQIPQVPVQSQNRMNNGNAFDTFSNNTGPFGGLEWK